MAERKQPEKKRGPEGWTKHRPGPDTTAKVGRKKAAVSQEAWPA